MGFLKRLVGQPAEPWPPPGPITSWPPSGGTLTVHAPAWTFDRDARRKVDVVGESLRQDELLRIAGGRTYDGPRIRDHMALLLPEPTNPVDVNAVRVFVAPSQGGNAAMIGYLSRDDAVAYRPVIERVAAQGRVMLVNASLVGGWDRDVSLGVLLRIGAPWVLMAEMDREDGPDPAWPPQFTAFGDDGRPYNRTTCPSCDAALDPLPKSKKKCPSCGAYIWVRSGPDDVHYLLKEADLAAHDARWKELFRD